MTLVSGILIDSSGDPIPGAVLTLAPHRRAAFARSSGVQVPDPISVTADAAGAVSFIALPGLMVGEVQAGGGKWGIELRIPDTATASLTDCVEAGGGELPPASVAAVQDIRDQLLAALAGIGGAAPSVAISASTTADPDLSGVVYRASASLTLTLPPSPPDNFVLGVTTDAAVSVTLIPGALTVEGGNTIWPGSGSWLVYSGGSWRRRFIRGFGTGTVGSLGILVDAADPNTPAGWWQITSATLNIDFLPAFLRGYPLLCWIGRLNSGTASQVVYDPVPTGSGVWSRCYGAGAWSALGNGYPIAAIATASLPASAQPGTMVWDTTAGRLVVWDGAAWDAAATLTDIPAAVASLSGVNTGDQTIMLQGDVIGSGTGIINAVMPNTGVNPTTFGSATSSARLTIDAKGRVTAGSTLTITPAWPNVTGKPTTVATSGLTDAVSTSDLATALAPYQPTSAKGAAGGYAGLDGTGRVPSAQLPSYVDDVVEAANAAAFPGTGESGKIYIALDTGKTWRWSGSAYVEIVSAPGTTDVVTEGATNLYFTGARAIASGLTGFLTSVSRTAMAASDTVLSALQKVQKYLDDLSAVAFSGAFADITGGDIPWLTPAAGEYVLTTMGSGTSTGTVAGGAGRLDIYPFTPGATITITGVAINVSTLVASAVARVVIYAADANGRPAALLYQSADLDCSTTGIKTALASLTLPKGQFFWLGVWTSSTATLSTWGLNTTPDINGGAAPSTLARKILRRTVSFAGGAPDPWVWNSSEITGGASATAIWLKV